MVISMSIEKDNSNKYYPFVLTIKGKLIYATRKEANEIMKILATLK